MEGKAMKQILFSQSILHCSFLLFFILFFILILYIYIYIFIIIAILNLRKKIKENYHFQNILR